MYHFHINRLSQIVIAINPFNAHQYSKVFVIALMTDFKEQGNRLFSERRYAEAIEAYTSAIVSILLYQAVIVQSVPTHR